MTARYPFYLLADSEHGQLKEGELSGIAPPSPLPRTDSDVKKGFVYERVPHVTLKSIANNLDIHGRMSRENIDAAIARHAETELLYDRPYKDPKVVRVSGPFTVESLSPHRVLSPAGGDVPDPEPIPDADAGRFVEHVLDNLRKAGVQNTVKDERLQFGRLEPWPGVHIQASGDYVENDSMRTVAVSIGPEHGTVDRQIVDAAAKEAVRFADLLVVCGFAFDAYASETTHLGNLTILQAKMNPDLQMPDLLKKTGAGNLFMVFGEPDIEIRTGEDGMLTVEIRGLDVYDPTTGVVRSHSTHDIACWFLDTNYNEESFFVRHAYFLGSDDPYDKLKRVLRADIDEAAWASLYSTVSRPFPKPATGKIAVKVINHYGDEVLKVYDVNNRKGSP
jgi:adenine-specific DNA-methyltransferase